MSRSIIIDHKANVKPRIFVKEVLPFPLLQSGRRSKSPYYEEPASEREEWWRSTLKVICDLYIVVSLTALILSRLKVISPEVKSPRSLESILKCLFVVL